MDFDRDWSLDFPLDFPRAYGGPPVSAGFRTFPEDFQVDEELGLEPEGAGEHWLVRLRKRDDNTDWVAGRLAACAGVPKRDVGYCGLKDRRAVATQWFSVYQPRGDVPRWSDLEKEGPTLLEVHRHGRKLRRGQHRSNRFVIRLRDVTPESAGGSEELERILTRVARDGVPNYFGAQRFGRDGANLSQARDWLETGRRIHNRRQRGLVMSAARSWLFNQVLAARVHAGDWRTVLAGEPGEAPSGPLWGRGRPLATEETETVEAHALAPWQAWCEGLEHVGLKQERRSLVLKPARLSWHWEDDRDLVLSFALAPGGFATAVLAELARFIAPPPRA